jgi:interferon-induced transmembrane protein/TIR domain-containing protein
VSKIFISYRRQDSPGYAGRICDHVSRHFGDDAVFRDVETLEGGVDFVEAINSALSVCGAFILVIGPRWLGAKDSQGRKRLDLAADFVRMELASALARKIRVIPLLVEGAIMPGADELPSELQPLVRRQAIEITDARFDADIEQVIRALESALGRSSRVLSSQPPSFGIQPPTGPSRPPVTATPSGAVPNYLVWSIVSTACLCLPLGIVGIVQSNKAAAALAAGDPAGAQALAASARKWNLLALALGGVGWFIALIAGAMSGQQ